MAYIPSIIGYRSRLERPIFVHPASLSTQCPTDPVDWNCCGPMAPDLRVPRAHTTDARLGHAARALRTCSRPVEGTPAAEGNFQPSAAISRSMIPRPHAIEIACRMSQSEVVLEETVAMTTNPWSYVRQWARDPT